MQTPRVLIIAGFDPSGRAGLIADSEAVWRAGAIPVGCITALTSQLLSGPVRIEQSSNEMVLAQIEAAIESGPVGAVKMGMLAHSDLVRPLVEILINRLPPVPIVVDPVLATTTGAPLLLGGSRRAVYREVSRLRPILTPNLIELGVLAGCPQAGDNPEEVRQAEQVLTWGASAILVKGGHRQGPTEDFLISADGSEQRFYGERIPSTARGKGCRLSSALAAHLAQGLELPAAIERARQLVRAHLQKSAA